MTEPAQHRMKTKLPCPVDPDLGHLMVDQGHSLQYAAHVYECACGLRQLAETDEHRERFGEKP